MDTRSPFKKLTSMSAIVSKVNAFIPASFDEEEGRDDVEFGAVSHYNVGVECFYRLFEARDYSTSLSVVSSTDEIMIPDNVLQYKDKRIMLVVCDEPPTQGTQIIGDKPFHLKLVCLV